MNNLPRLLCFVLILGFSLGMDCQGNGAGSLLPQLTLSLTIVGQGRIERIGPDGNTPFSGDVFGEGTAVSLVARPSNGWVLIEWSGDLSSSESNAVIIMDSDKSVTAKFVALAGARTVTVNGVTGRMTLALKDNQIRGNRRAGGSLGVDLIGSINGKQITITDSCPGCQDAIISATLQQDGSITGIINGSIFSNAPFTSDPVSTAWTDHDESGQRTTLITAHDGSQSVAGLLTAVVTGNSILGTWRTDRVASVGWDINGTLSGNKVNFIATNTIRDPLTINATIQTNGSWIGTASSPGVPDGSFVAQPSIFP